MALVDYGSSDEESINECENEETDRKQTNLISECQQSEVNRVVHNNDNSSLFSSLPKPINSFTFVGDDRKIKNLLQSKTDNLSSRAKSDSKSVKIYAPSVSEFKEEPSPKKLKPSVKGVGLFSILPPPKNVSVKESTKTLVPNSVKKNYSEKVLEKKTLQNQKHTSIQNSKLETKENDSEDNVEDEDDNPIIGNSFFGPCLLGSSNTDVSEDKIKPSVSSKIFLKLPNEETQHVNETLIDSLDTKNTCVCEPSFSNSQNLVTDSDHEETLSEQETIVCDKNPLELDEKALQILCGGKRKRQHISMNMIDLSGEEIMPNSKEWLIKQLTEERKVKSHSHRKNQGPSTQQRRKHQITYLAFQAKEQELELQNQWAQNRMSRKQTQSKYGF